MEIEQKYQIIKKLGQGGYGITYLTKGKDGDYYACKVIDIAKAQQNGTNVNDLQEEINALIQLSSNPHCYPYIACYYEYYNTKFQGRRSLCIIMEYVNGPTLEEMIERMNESQYVLPGEQMWKYIYQLISAVNYIHKMGYAHRDIKTGNIILDTMNNNMKLIDFGFACKNSCGDLVGSAYWMPPEAFSLTHPRSLSSAQAHDIWSLGIVLYELANLELPYYLPEELNFDQVKKIIEDHPIRSFYKSGSKRDNAINTLIEIVLNKDWKNRPRAKTLLRFMEIYML